jgi:hypothetical protein
LLNLSLRARIASATGRDENSRGGEDGGTW